MTLILSGTDGLSDVDGSAATPAIRGTDTNTGIFFPAADTIAFSEGGVESMRLDSSGNLGIGTSSPGQRLEVSNSSTNTTFSTVGNQLLIRNSGSTANAFARIDFTGSTNNPMASIAAQFENYGTGATSIIFGNTNTGTGSITERARITSGGVLCVGNTATGDATGAHIQASTITNSNVGVLRVQSIKTADSADTCISVFKNANDSTTAQVFVRFLMNAGNTGQGQINANGANAAAFGTYSDARLKENIVDLPSQLTNICSLRPVEFDYVESEGGGHQTGFIAQEMQQVYPDAVGERAPDGMLTITGWDKTTARLVKAIQEQQAIIQSLTARIEALESKGA